MEKACEALDAEPQKEAPKTACTFSARETRGGCYYSVRLGGTSQGAWGCRTGARGRPWTQSCLGP